MYAEHRKVDRLFGIAITLSFQRKTMIDRIICTVTVNDSRSSAEILAGMDRKQRVNDEVVRTMPKGETGQRAVIFFRIGAFAKFDAIDAAFDLRDLDPVDPHTLTALNEDDPAFADDYPNITYWKDENGNLCYAGFVCWNHERMVEVARSEGNGCDHFWWFGGVARK
mgnify:FL=1